ncbi:hypothetical protein G3I36_27195 [Streptomyces sp. SID10362]|uniref:hypothetical protein n=1 Tax=Streptomyces sp. SID10362 TaxID=2706021 RepID=UPI0013C8C861|nr:hypothetical protein [Streptomyces sp. SID10362]NDZ74660.1 hypothetical protein [Streptomyces sp. SID10362]
MTILNDFLREYVAPVLSAAGFKKKGAEYRFTNEAGDSAFLTFSTTRLDPETCVFFATCSFVPEPYWAWLNRRQAEAKFPPTDASGVLAAYSVLPPDAFAHAPAPSGLARARWAFSDRNRSSVGTGLAGQLKTEELPRIERLLMRPGLLAEITSSRSPSVRRWGAVQSELVLMADHYTTQQQEMLLAAPDLDDTFRRDYREWVAKRATSGG